LVERVEKVFTATPSSFTQETLLKKSSKKVDKAITKITKKFVKNNHLGSREMKITPNAKTKDQPTIVIGKSYQMY